MSFSHCSFCCVDFSSCRVHYLKPSILIFSELNHEEMVNGVSDGECEKRGKGKSEWNGSGAGERVGGRERGVKGAAGERDNGYKQKAEVKRHGNKSPHFWGLSTVCSIPLSLSRYNCSSQ